jgi:molybdopterin/thiamine biosynthesis adenylyltransferase/rhodanese-related sulfurtransferase
MDIQLTQEEFLRYSRNLLLPQVGIKGQKKLKSASVLIVGLGGLGSPVALYLAAAGVGRLGLADYDVVDCSNLQRQVIHSFAAIGQPKTLSARTRLYELNPNIQIDVTDKPLTSMNAIQMIAPYQIIVDATDNFPSRYLLNDACYLSNKPLVHGSIYRFEGQASVFDGHRSACYRCVFPSPPPPELVPSCSDGGVLGVLPGLIGIIQATEAIKLMLGLNCSLLGSILMYDALQLSFQHVQLHKNPDCPLCGNNPTISSLINYEDFCRTSIRSDDRPGDDENLIITPAELAQVLRENAPISVIDIREPHEQEISQISGSQLIPFGTLASQADRLKKTDDIILFCRTDSRSRRAVHILINAGFNQVRYLKGGINAWAAEVDGSIPQY